MIVNKITGISGLSSSTYMSNEDLVVDNGEICFVATADTPDKVNATAFTIPASISGNLNSDYVYLSGETNGNDFKLALLDKTEQTAVFADGFDISNGGYTSALVVQGSKQSTSTFNLVFRESDDSYDFVPGNDGYWPAFGIIDHCSSDDTISVNIKVTGETTIVFDGSSTKAISVPGNWQDSGTYTGEGGESAGGTTYTNSTVKWDVDIPEGYSVTYKIDDNTVSESTFFSTDGAINKQAKAQIIVTKD